MAHFTKIASDAWGGTPAERLSGMDSAFLYLETPRAHMHVALVGILDASERGSAATVEAIHAHIAERALHIPEFRRKLLPVPFELDHPRWIDDPDFEVIEHVRRASVKAPGGLAELAEVSARIASTPLCRERPLWEIWIIDGLEDERVAVLIKLHHANVDGASALKLLGRLFDGTPEGSEIGAPTPLAPLLPNWLELFGDAARHRLEHPSTVFSLALRTTRAIRDLAARRPRRAAGGGVDGDHPGRHRVGARGQGDEPRLGPLHLIGDRGELSPRAPSDHLEEHPGREGGA